MKARRIKKAIQKVFQRRPLTQIETRIVRRECKMACPAGIAEATRLFAGEPSLLTQCTIAGFWRKVKV